MKVYTLPFVFISEDELHTSLPIQGIKIKINAHFISKLIPKVNVSIS